MDDFDPFSRKVGDVYNQYGQRVGSVRDVGSMSPLGYLLIVGTIGVLLCGGLIAGVTSGIASLRNFVTYGEFTTDSRKAEYNANRNNPNYFAEHAKRAKISVISLGTVAYDPVQYDFSVAVGVMNGDDKPHAVLLSSIGAEIAYRDSFARRVVEIGREKCSPSDRVEWFTLNAHTALDVVTFLCGWQDQREGIVEEGPTVVTQPSVPSVIGIDGYPVTGGPPNASPYY